MKKNFPSSTIWLLWNTGRAESALDSFPISMSLILFWEYHYEQVDFYIFGMFQSIPCSHYLLYFLMLKISLFCPVGWLQVGSFGLIAFFCSWTQYVPGSSCTLSVWDLKWAILPRSPKFFLLKVVFINYTWGNRDTYCYRITEYLSFSVENTRKYVFFLWENMS